MPADAALRVSAARGTLGGVFARERGRLALATLAIALGVALGYAIALVNRAAVAEFASGMAALSGVADLEVRGARAGFDENVYPEVARIDGVAVASPVVEVAVRLAGRDEALRVLGIDPLRAAAVTPALIGIAEQGLDLLDPEALWLSPAAALALGVQPGEHLPVQVGTAKVALRVAGLTPDGGGARYATMDVGAAQDRFGRIGALTRIDVRVRPGADPAAVQQRIRAVLPAGAAVTPPAAGIDAAMRASRAYRINLDVLALVALFTGGLLVFSTQALAVTRRRAQFALLRTLGLTRRRLVRLVVAEGAMIGAAGAVIGIAAGHLLARFALDRFGGDLGAGFFRGLTPELRADVAAACLFAALGILAAMAGSFLPALEAARAAPAQALKPGDTEVVFARFEGVWPGATLIAFGMLATLPPPVADLPLFGYLAIALLVVGTLLLLPRIAAAMLAHVPRPPQVPAALALDQLRNAPGQATVSLAAIVASAALMVSMAIMVTSFRDSLDEWLQRVLPADVYVRPGPGADTAFLAPAEQERIAQASGVERVEFARTQSVLLDPARPRVTLIARTQDDPAGRLPLVGEAVVPGPGEPPPVWVSEAIVDLYGFAPGQRVTLPLAGVPTDFTVAGVWRDYVRQQGALLIDRARYIDATGDRDASEAAVWLAPGTSVAEFVGAVEGALGASDRVAIATAGEIRELSLRAFDRTFAVTYALEAAAVVIGLAGLASSFGALALARRREFGMLRHLGMTRRQVGAMLATEGLAVSGIGLVAGLTLGFAISLILIHVVNRQSFHWSMDLSVPWAGLALFALALLALALVTTLVAAREAMSEAAVRVVKDDW
jgi:putative ABC transport system permease protein